MYDNTSAINIAENPCQHTKIKHIEIRHHFLRDIVEKKRVCVLYCETTYYIFTKALNRPQFEKNRLDLGLIFEN